MATAAAAVGVWLLVVIALAVVQAVLMNERRGELGVWRVVGASPARVARLMAREALLVHAAGACAGRTPRKPRASGDDPPMRIRTIKPEL